MKISRKDLRNIIYESLLREQEADSKTASAGARKNTDNPAIRGQIEKQVKSILDGKIPTNEAHNSIIVVGKNSIVIRKKAGYEIDKDIFIKNNNLSNLRKKLKVADRVFVTYSKDAGKKNSDTKAKEATVNAVTQASETDPSKESNTNEYPGINDKDPYIYKVNKETGCWETKKKNSDGNWISLRNNQKATDTLDDSYPSARDEDDKNKCKVKTAKASTKSDDKDVAQTNTTAPKVDNATNAAPQKRSADTSTSSVNRIIEYSFDTTDAKFRNYVLTKYPKLGILLPSIEPGSPGNGKYFSIDTVKYPMEGYYKPILDWLYHKRVRGDFSNVPDNLRFSEQMAKQLTGNNFTAQANSYYDFLIQDNIMAGSSEADQVKKVLKVVFEAFARINNAYNVTVNYKNRNTNESFGKSHATLIRERYWGRY